MWLWWFGCCGSSGCCGGSGRVFGFVGGGNGGGSCGGGGGGVSRAVAVVAVVSVLGCGGCVGCCCDGALVLTAVVSVAKNRCKSQIGFVVCKRRSYESHEVARPNKQLSTQGCSQRDLLRKSGFQSEPNQIEERHVLIRAFLVQSSSILYGESCKTDKRPAQAE